MMIAVSICLLVFINIISADRWPKSDCKFHTDNCNNWCGEQSTQMDVCHALDNDSCWIGGFIPLPGKICKCQCTDRLYGECTFDQIMKGKSSCSSEVTNLDNIDDEIAKSMGFNIGVNVLGNVLDAVVPGLGAVTDIAWAGWSNSAAGPISSPQQLTNNLINGINEKFDHLKDCMNEKIDNLKTELYEGKVRNIARRYYQIRNANDGDKIDYLSNLFSDFNGYIGDIFMDDTGINSNYDHSQYLSLLPVYTALVPIWAALSHDQLLVQKYQNDDKNFNSDLNTAIDGFDIMKSWVLRAIDNIANSLEPQDIVCKPYEKVSFKTRASECGYQPLYNGRTCSSAYTDDLARKIISINDKISEWKNTFNAQYLTKINFYIESLERIKDGDATSDNIIKDNVLEIKNMKGKCLDIHDEDYNANINGGKVQIWTCSAINNGADNQKWYYDMDTKQIKNKQDKCLDIHSPDYISNSDGGKIQIWECNGEDNQKFDYDWSTLEIKNMKGKCLDIHDEDYNANINGGKVQIWTCHGENNQKWNLYPDFIEN